MKTPTDEQPNTPHHKVTHQALHSVTPDLSWTPWIADPPLQDPWMLPKRAPPGHPSWIRSI